MVNRSNNAQTIASDLGCDAVRICAGAALEVPEAFCLLHASCMHSHCFDGLCRACWICVYILWTAVIVIVSGLLAFIVWGNNDVVYWDSLKAKISIVPHTHCQQPQQSPAKYMLHPRGR